MVNLLLNELTARPQRKYIYLSLHFTTHFGVDWTHVMATCGTTVFPLFPDRSGITALSLQHFPELNKLSICLGKSLFFSPGLCENSGQFQTIQTQDCECMQAWLWVRVSECAYVCVCECMSECSYASQRGGGQCLDSIRCTGFNLPLLFNLLSKLYILHLNTKHRQEKKLNNKRTTCMFPILKDPSLYKNNLSQVSVSHIWLMHAIVNTLTASHDRLRKPLGRGSKKDWENV